MLYVTGKAWKGLGSLLCILFNDRTDGGGELGVTRCQTMSRTDCISQTDCVMTKWAHIWAVWNVVKTKSPSSHWLLDWFPFQVWECFENSGYLKNGFYTAKNCSIYIYHPLYGVLALPNKYLEPQPKLMAHGFQTSQARPKAFLSCHKGLALAHGFKLGCAHHYS